MQAHCRMILLLLVATTACLLGLGSAAWQENVRPKMYVQLGE